MGSEYQYAGLRNPRSPGLPVEVCSARLHRLAHAESRLMFLEAAHVISTPGRDAKALLSRCQYEDGQHADRLRHRLTELRVSRRRAFEEPDPDLEILFDEAMHSRGTAELLAALALVIKPAMVEAYRRYERETNGLADYGSLRALREIVAEERRGSPSCVRRTPTRSGRRPGRGRPRRNGPPTCGSCSRRPGASTAAAGSGRKRCAPAAGGPPTGSRGSRPGTTPSRGSGTSSTSARRRCPRAWRR